ncbi:MAG: DMT family transporter [Chloroflexota bacterium]
MNSQARRLKADLSLLLVTAIWGTTFVIVKNAVATIDPYTFIALRFNLAFVVLALVFWKRLLRLDWPTLRAGIVVGIFLLAGFGFQTFGLQLVSASKGGFITGLSVVMVPFLAWRIVNQTPSRNAVVGVVLATAGLLLLSLKEDWTVEYGDLLVLACALAFALHIVFIGKYAPHHDALNLATVQLGFVAATSGVMALVFDGIPAGLPSDGLLAAVFTGVVATALAYALQNKAQVFTTPTHTALIFAMEPVFAALFAVVWAGESLTERAVLGGVLILGGMLVAEVPRKT